MKTNSISIMYGQIVIFAVLLAGLVVAWSVLRQYPLSTSQDYALTSSVTE